jgi:uncharacterized protein (TIGR03083 family)
MDTDLVWRHIHRERRELARALATFDESEWAAESLCPGWTAKDVAAHVISTPQIGWRQLPGMAGRNLGRGYNQMIFREVKRISAGQTPQTILDDFVAYAASRHHVPTTTVVEPMVDVLVHTQDILRPLGRRHEMPPDAAAVAADRCRALAFLMGSRRVIKSVRMVATDYDWARGKGPTVQAPMQELLMLCAGRSPDPDLVTGDGLEALATMAQA